MHGFSSGTGGCTNPEAPETKIIYNADDRVLQACAGNVWKAMGPVRYVQHGAYFDGTNDYLHVNSLTVSDSKQMTGSLWIRPEIDGTFQTIINTELGIEIRKGDTNNFRIRGWNASGTLILDMAIGGAVEPVLAGVWRHILFSFDLSDVSKAHIYYDDEPYFVNKNVYIDDSIDFTRPDYYVGSNPLLANKMQGDLADVWLDMGTYIDLSVESNRRKFINADEKPVDLGADGSNPTGTTPDIFLSGDASVLACQQRLRWRIHGERLLKCGRRLFRR